jgi:hypothetical protein
MGYAIGKGYKSGGTALKTNSNLGTLVRPEFCRRLLEYQKKRACNIRLSFYFYRKILALVSPIHSVLIKAYLLISPEKSFERLNFHNNTINLLVLFHIQPSSIFV